MVLWKKKRKTKNAQKNDKPARKFRSLSVGAIRHVFVSFVCLFDCLSLRKLCSDPFDGINLEFVVAVVVFSILKSRRIFSGIFGTLILAFTQRVLFCNLTGRNLADFF